VDGVPFEVIYEPGTSAFVEMRFSSHVTKSEFIQAIRRVRIAHESGMNRELVDDRTVVNPGDLLDWTLAFGLRDFPAGHRMAVLPGANSRMAALARSGNAPIGSSSGVEIRLFEDRDEAISWLMRDHKPGAARV
jgi:hypothetical protein